MIKEQKYEDTKPIIEYIYKKRPIQACAHCVIYVEHMFLFLIIPAMRRSFQSSSFDESCVLFVVVTVSMSNSTVFLIRKVYQYRYRAFNCPASDIHGSKCLISFQLFFSVIFLFSAFCSVIFNE